MKEKKRVIFVNIPHAILQERLEEAGYICDMAADMPYEEVMRIIHKYNGLIINSRFFIGQDFLDSATHLEFIGRVGSGMDSIDVEYAEKKGIRCFNSPEGNRDAVGEHCLGLLLSLVNNIVRADKEVRDNLWLREENRGMELKGKTLGIIGYGHMGSAFLERLLCLGLRILVYDKYKKGFGNNFITECSLQELQQEADIISFHVPLTEETRYMFDTNFIDECGKPFWLINTSRGSVVKTDDLAEALKSGKILGAGLDVLEYEDISFTKMKTEEQPEALQYLLQSQQVILTPHIAGWTKESKFKLASILADKILKVF